MNPQPAVLVVTGASGAGKTTAVRALDGMRLPGVRCHQTDSLPVPSTEEMVRRWGGTLEWQNASTDYWIELLLRNDDGAEAAVLDGQIRPHVARLAFERLGARAARVVLVDCAPDERNARLRGPRAQPDLANAQMDCWAACAARPTRSPSPSSTPPRGRRKTRPRSSPRTSAISSTCAGDFTSGDGKRGMGDVFVAWMRRHGTRSAPVWPTCAAR